MPASLLPSRLLLALAIIIGGGWLALAGTLPSVLGPLGAGLLPLPSSAGALAARAEQAVSPNGVPPSAAVDARRALALDPTQVVALHVLAADAAFRGYPERMDRLLAYSERLSRRDLRTQLLLIQDRVEAGDVAGALVHYDRALRTSRSAPPLLIPILVKATASPSVIAPLAQMMQHRPLWWRSLAAGLLAPGAQVAAIRPVYEALRLDPAHPEEASLLAQALGQLVAAHRHADAAALFRQATGQRAGDLRNGSFDAAPSGLTPFDWWLASDSDLSASIDSAGDVGNDVLLVTAAHRTGSVARQLLLLRPGRYRLNFAAGGDPANAAPRIVLRCDGPAGRLLVTQPATPAAGRAGAELAVPGDCPAQWLSIDVTGTTATVMPWIDALRVIALR